MTASDLKPLLPGATLGVLGGGQLGRMFVHQAQAMGYFTAVLDADPTSPAGLVSHHHIQTGYEDPQGLAELARVADAVTTEFENVPAAALAALAAQRPVSPAASAVSGEHSPSRQAPVERASIVTSHCHCLFFSRLSWTVSVPCGRQTVLPAQQANVGDTGAGAAHRQRIVAQHDIGTHCVFYVEISEIKVHDAERAPALVYFRRHFHGLA